MKKKKNYSASEQLQAMTSQWANSETIMIIGGVGMNKALKIRQEIEKQIMDEGYRLPKQAIVPMKYVIDYFKIDINYLKKLSNLEKGIEK